MLFGENLERKRGKNTPLERTLERTMGRKIPLKYKRLTRLGYAVDRIFLYEV